MDNPSSTQSLRLFIAIAIPDEVKTKIEKAQAELRDLLDEQSIRWTRPDHFHLTLKFLGNVNSDHVQPLIDAVQHVCNGFAAFQLAAHQIGFFPERGLPRIVWVAINDPTQRLTQLQHAVEIATSPFTTEAAESKFTGHVTLARIKAPNRNQAKILSEFGSRMAGCSFGHWTADHVGIMRSELSSAGATHTFLARVPLQI
jgi:RNA 2',3'-cyclic 3'-phosphodiesterase